MEDKIIKHSKLVKSSLNLVKMFFLVFLLVEYGIGDGCDLWLFLNNGHGVIKVVSNSLFNKFGKQFGEV